MRTPALLAIVLLLSGCSGKDGGGGGDGNTPDDGEVMAVEAPEWAIGDYWNFTASDGTSTTMVVIGEQGTDWIIGTDNQGFAWFDTLFDISIMGAVSKGELKGSQGDQRVEYFRWPLTDAQEWTMSLDGQSLDVVAHDMQEGLWHFEASNETGLYTSYIYDVESEWFQRQAFYGPDGTEQFAIELNEAGHNFTGEIDTWTFEELYFSEGSLAGATSEAENFDVPLDATDVYASVHIDCTAGEITIGVAPFPVAHGVLGLEDRGAGSGDPPCPQQVDFDGSAGAAEAPPQGGETELWTAGVLVTPDAEGTYSLQVLLRYLTSTPFPA